MEDFEMEDFEMVWKVYYRDRYNTKKYGKL